MCDADVGGYSGDCSDGGFVYSLLRSSCILFKGMVKESSRTRCVMVTLVVMVVYVVLLL